MPRVKFIPVSYTHLDVYKRQAYFNSGAVLYVPDNVEIDLPLEGIFLQDSASNVPLNKHVLIIAGRHAKVNYLERFETIGDSDVKAVSYTHLDVYKRQLPCCLPFL